MTTHGRLVAWDCHSKITMTDGAFLLFIAWAKNNLAA